MSDGPIRTGHVHLDGKPCSRADEGCGWGNPDNATEPVQPYTDEQADELAASMQDATTKPATVGDVMDEVRDVRGRIDAAVQAERARIERILLERRERCLATHADDSESWPARGDARHEAVVILALLAAIDKEGDDA